jgi:DNA-binding response OmpR family regulator
MKESGMLRILVVEDDIRMLELLCRGLREAGHAVMPAPDGEAALELATRLDFDALVLDVGLPHRDGFAVTLALRAENPSVGIIILTARDSEDDVVRGLDLGADDYLVKPFSFPELIARLQALHRTRSFGRYTALKFDPARLTVLRDNITIELTRTEYLLLRSLTQAEGTTVTRLRLMESIWGNANLVPSNSLDVLVNGLRAKVDAPFDLKLISTVRGVGYRLLDQRHGVSSGEAETVR